MWLVLDLGNTAVKGALFDGARLVRAFPLDLTPPARGEAGPPAAAAWDAALAPGVGAASVTRAGLVSVVPALRPGAEAALARRTGTAPTVVGPDLRLPFALAYATPATLGADRLAAAAAAWTQHGGGGRPVVVVDAGTAVTYEVITPASEGPESAGAEGEATYHGGPIAPGPALASRALHDGTAQLPVVPLAFPTDDPLGRSTQAAVQHGVMAGFADAVRGMLARLARHLGTPPTVVLTGGWAAWLRTHVPAAALAGDAPGGHAPDEAAAFAAAAVHVEPHLVLRGARALTALHARG